MNGFRTNTEHSATPISPSNSAASGNDSKRERMVKITLNSISKSQVQDLKRKLRDELDHVRSWVKRLEAEEEEVKNSKSNPYSKKSNFVHEKNKPTPKEGNKKLKPNNGGKKVDGFEPDKGTTQIFKSCNDLLANLMKHKFGWVFNKPVDVKGLGLHDYYTIIKTPMDLGTVKTRLSKNWYKSPKEFAEDVRLTFSNAMLYNPKGQDVHHMAEQLSRIFEKKWASVEAQYGNLTRKSKVTRDDDLHKPVSAAARYSEQLPTSPVVENRTLERAESMTMPVDPKRMTEEKEESKREMTYEEKRKLSEDLQDLPSDKLENIVHIIKKRNPGLSQEDDEIEVDIESVDPETLWELHEFVTEHKEFLGKNKRGPEFAFQADAESCHNVIPEMDAVAVVTETTKGFESVEKSHTASSPFQQQKQKQADIGIGSSSSNSSSSDSVSNSSDSDSQ